MSSPEANQPAVKKEISQTAGTIAVQQGQGTARRLLCAVLGVATLGIVLPAMTRNLNTLTSDDSANWKNDPNSWQSIGNKKELAGKIDHHFKAFLKTDDDIEAMECIAWISAHGLSLSSWHQAGSDEARCLEKAEQHMRNVFEMAKNLTSPVNDDDIESNGTLLEDRLRMGLDRIRGSSTTDTQEEKLIAANNFLLADEQNPLRLLDLANCCENFLGRTHDTPSIGDQTRMLEIARRTYLDVATDYPEFEQALSNYAHNIDFQITDYTSPIPTQTIARTSLIK
jgi:hypothetical protein